ncbi:MAG: hypothetical protein AUI10_13110 [Actinobacteria bacterium 13_2_20CM_2_72_6]|nr:MAG: hypothetical protein AUI10_13110 [Actinobacteria bacterium 13_2_20CM_2_72_6]
MSGVIHSSRSRVCAIVAAVATPLGALGLGLVIGRLPPDARYISEAGVAGAPHALAYRLILFLLAVAAGAAAVGLRPVAGRAALVLGLAAPCLLVSGSVPCSAGCPLPPYERPTAGDLVHAGASMAAVGLCTLAMLAAARWSTDLRVRAGARWAAVLMVPLGTATLAALLLAGRTPFTGVVERLSIGLCFAWVTGASLATARGS